MTTLIENGTVVGFNGEGHAMLDEGVVTFEGDRIIHVGKSYSGSVDKRVDARGKLVTPGFINAHCHSQTPVSPHHLTVDVSLDAYYQHDGVGMLTPSRAPRTSSRTAMTGLRSPGFPWRRGSPQGAPLSWRSAAATGSSWVSPLSWA